MKFSSPFLYLHLGSLTYTSGSSGLQLEAANFADGTIRVSGASQEINYFLTDHLGSVRAIVDENGNVKERNDYYAFGAKHIRPDYAQNTNRYDYNGKEEQTTGDLGFLDYGARMYDATLGRWFGIDQLAEKYFSFGPFTYTANNPINAIDPDGRLIIFISGWDPEQNISRFFYNLGYHLKQHGVQLPELQQIDRSMSDIQNYMGGRLSALYSRAFNDFNVSFIDGHYDWPSSASKRFEDGYNHGVNLVDKLISGEITLKENETIKIVGHSMGAAYAAGMAHAISALNYGHLLELVDYLAPYQPGKFSHPDGIFGRQFGSMNDWLSEYGKIQIKGVRIFEIGDIGGGFRDWGHWGSELTNWLSNAISAGIPVYVK